MKMVTQKIHNYIAYKSLMKNVPQRWEKTFKMPYIMCSTTLRPQKKKKIIKFIRELVQIQNENTI